VAFLFVTALSPGVARAQQPSKPMVGFLADGTPEGFATRLTGVKRGLAAAGLAEGSSVLIEPRWAGGNYDLLPQFAGELVAAKAAVIVTAGSEKVVRAAMAATKSVPIVATMAGDPVKRGVVSSISRPGGNVTVVSLFTSSSNALVAKRVELLHEIAPNAKTVGWLVDANILDFDDELHDVQNAVHALGLEVKVAQVTRPADVEEAFRSLVQQGTGVLVETGPIFNSNRAKLIDLVARASLPALYEWRDFADDGGLMTYGTNLLGVFQQCGTYAARIIKGEKVGDLPVVQEPRIELVVNLKTARALGLTVPPSLLARADAVID
jgi:putative tryptophan/tyrosine transport system substrate-binding protein